MEKSMAKKTTKSAARPKKIAPAPKPRSKSEFISTIAEQTQLSRKQVSSVFDAMSGVMAADLGRGGPGLVTVPGMMKVLVKRMPATKARKGINPFTKEEITIKAKPARNVVKIRPLKNLKTMV
jgi:nucleoid DNA-binding protein